MGLEGRPDAHLLRLRLRVRLRVELRLGVRRRVPCCQCRSSAG